MRVTVAKLSFSHARFSIGRSHVKVRRIKKVHLTEDGATRWTARSGRRTSSPGQKIATARTLVRF